MIPVRPFVGEVKHLAAGYQQADTPSVLPQFAGRQRPGVFHQRPGRLVAGHRLLHRARDPEKGRLAAFDPRAGKVTGFFDGEQHEKYHHPSRLTRPRRGHGVPAGSDPPIRHSSLPPSAAATHSEPNRSRAAAAQRCGQGQRFSQARDERPPPRCRRRDPPIRCGSAARTAAFRRPTSCRGA